MTADEQPEPLATALARQPFLDALAGSPRSKRDLVEELSVSRSTVDRVVRRLEREGFLAQRHGDCRLTHVGRLLASLAATASDVAAEVTAARPVLDALPPTCPVSLALVADATVMPATPPAPKRPLERMLELLSTATRYRGFAVAVTESRFPRTFHDQVVDAGADGELVFEDPLVEDVLVDQTDLVGRMVDAGFTALVAEDLPCGLLLLDTPAGRVVAVAAYDEHGALAGVLVNDTPAALAWGEALYGHHRSRATDVTAAF